MAFHPPTGNTRGLAAARPFLSFLFSTRRSAMLFLLILLAAGMAHAAPLPDSTGPFRDDVIMYVGYLNSGCHEDTLVGHFDEHLVLWPDGVRWGGYDSLRTPPCPPDSLGHYHRPRYPFTQFTFPEWDDLRVSLVIDSLNGDTLSDLLFLFTGTYTDSSGVHDTASVFCVFGQNAIDSVTDIRLDTLHGFVSAPYFAMEFQRGVQLSEPEHRDYSGVVSWALNTVVQAVPQSTRTPETPSAVPVARAASPRIQVYPNPASSAAHLEGTTVPAGEYVIEVLSVNGTTERRQRVRVAETGELFQVIDLHDLPSGYYLLRLFTAGDRSGAAADVVTTTGAIFGAYPIIVTR
jgi:hypothetical protein